ncbi:unnamed protein product, partial [Brugia timori]
MSFLKQKSQRQEKPIICNLIMDEMSIRKQLVVKNKDLYGPVNLGFHRERHEEELEEMEDGNADESTLPPLAKNALVFMLVALNDSWKVPCGYFFVNSLNGTERANLLRKAFDLLHEHGVIIPSLTFDGAAVNFSAARELGANFEPGSNFKPYFQHNVTNQKVYIFPDTSHMLKNVRNSFAKTQKFDKSTKNFCKRPFSDDEGLPISWEYIGKIVDTQNSVGLTLSRLTLRHVKYTESIMNVKLAAQTLSHSTSTALKYLEEDLKDPLFNGARGTAKFCMMFNNAFDLLNCRSLAVKSTFGHPVNEKNYSTLKAEADKIINYISSLKNSKGDAVIRGNQKC